MKKSLALLLSAFCTGAFAQSLVYHENFDLPSGSDSITSGTDTPGAAGWSTTSTLYTSPGQAGHVQGSIAGSTVYYETDPFSTVGNAYVRLSFSHIAKLLPSNKASIQISVDGGQNWSVLNEWHYQGYDPLFQDSSHFNAASYAVNIESSWQVIHSNAVPSGGWWKKEFFNLSGIASDTIGMTGYPDVRLRFSAFFKNADSITSHYSAGWFIDDIEVTASPTCELNPPRIDPYFEPFVCYLPTPEGPIAGRSSGNYPIGVFLTDQSGIGSVTLYYRINGGATMSKNLAFHQNQTFLMEYKDSITGVAPGDTVEYYLEISDQPCGNIRRFPEFGFRQFSPLVLPTRCGSSVCGRAPEVIRDFPWSEDFEGLRWEAGTGDGNSGTSHRGMMPIFPDGMWIPAPPLNQTYGWSVNEGATGTANTGPNGDNTSSSGKYLYTEFTQATGNAVAHLQTPCIDLSDSVPRVFSFSYHMYGSDINALWVGADTGTGSSVWIANYHKITGQQQSSSSDPWKRAVVNLTPFAGKIIKLRFTAVKTTGTGDSHDIAIDDLLIEDATGSDLSVIEITSPTVDLCNPGTSAPVGIKVLNNGSVVQNDIPVAYQVDNGSIVRDTITGANLQLMDTATFSFVPVLTLPISVPHQIKTWVEKGADNDLTNDTLSLSIPAYSGAPISSFPYLLTFENAVADTLSHGYIGSFNWQLNTTSGATSWAVARGVDNNRAKAPLEGLGKNKAFLLVRDSSTGTPEEALLESGCIDLGTLTAPVLTFAHYVDNFRNLEVLVRRTGELWTSVSLISGTPSTERVFSRAEVDLSSYTGEQIQIAFRTGLTPPNYQSAVALDNIVIREGNEEDLALLHVGQEIHDLTEGMTSLPNMELNGGFTGPFSGNMELGAELTQKCGGGNSYSGQQNLTYLGEWTGNLLNRTAQRSIPLNNALQPGVYDFKIWVHLASDNINGNDTIYGTTVVRPVLDVPYFQDFESCDPQFSGVGSNRQWEITDPNKSFVTNAYSGTKCAVTNADHPFLSPDPFEYLHSPTFAGLDTLAGVELRFRHNFDFGQDAYGLVQMWQNGQWTNAISNDYLNSPSNNFLRAETEGPAYAGVSGSWIYSAFELKPVQGNVSFRFAAKAEDVGGWAIDNFEIYVPPQHSASPLWLSFPNTIPKDGSNAIAVEIHNSGAKALTEVVLTVFVNGTQSFTEHKQFPALPPGTSKIVQLQNTINLQAGPSEIMIVTSYPNNRNDSYIPDDTLATNIELPGPVSSLPYCNGFENSPTLLPFDANLYRLDAAWEWAAPVTGNINGAHSGSKCWVTDMDGDYPELADKLLLTPSFSVQSGECYKFSFWHNYDTEFNFDGGQVEYSLDGGNSWLLLGEYGDSTWYNTPFVQALDLTDPGFSGSSNGWTEAWYLTEFDTTGNVQFRFRFASNASIGGDGWAIDDICFEEIGGTCASVSIEENDLGSAIGLYPNPAKDVLNIHFGGSFSGSAVLSIVDQRGSIIKTQTSEIEAGEAIELSIANLPKGVYSLKTNVGDQLAVKVFVKM